jgi:hypothetical protein
VDFVKKIESFFVFLVLHGLQQMSSPINKTGFPRYLRGDVRDLSQNYKYHSSILGPNLTNVSSKLYRAFNGFDKLNLLMVVPF